MSTEREYVTNPRGHVWVTEEGVIDIFAFSEGAFHNGPRCANCGYGFCHHCEDGPDHDCPSKETGSSHG